MQSVVILAGGTSGEREVSLRSGTAVAQALETAGFDVQLLDLGVDPAEHLAAMRAADVTFPVLHGAGGEDGVLQAYLEANDICYVGSDSVASALCFDKWAYHQVVEAAGLLMAPAALVQESTYHSNALAQEPYVLKPINGGSSIDTYIVRNLAEAPTENIAETFSRYPTMLMEKLIVGVELTVGVLGDNTLPIIEIIPPSDGEFDYDNKYNGKTQELCPPEHVGAEIQQRASELALQAHQLTKCRDFSRTDALYEVHSDSLFLLETNTIPGMTDQSLFPKMAATENIDMPTLTTRLVEMALGRKA